ncbi:MAG: transcriptional regulator, GntR family [Modestobacter sp.]|jgi:DNA-binding GntR family transcriptional regulator|nr:transcriptional regulator, GntR family [Modestobacter sp.]
MTEVHRVAAPLRKQIVELLRRAIIDFEFEPGERLVERVLCERFDVSRTVIREALRQLESEGLVTMVANRGPVVAQPTEAEAEALFEVRAVLEALAGRMFARRATAAQRAMLTQRLADVEMAFADGELSSVLPAKDAFYEALLDGADNPVIRATLLSIHARVSLLRGLSLQAEGRASRTLDELRAIVQAAVAGDEAAAWAACEAHVHAAADVAFGQLRSLTPEAATGGA